MKNFNFYFVNFSNPGMRMEIKQTEYEKSTADLLRFLLFTKTIKAESALLAVN